MPANLTPQYYEAEENFKKAATLEEEGEAKGSSFCFPCYLNSWQGEDQGE